jgi:hypothetical protein
MNKMNIEDIIETQSWDITCTKEVFEKIKFNENFLGLLPLARFVNSLRFCQEAIPFLKEISSLSGNRIRLNSFLFACSVLYEGFQLVNKLNQRYNKLDSFNEFSILLRDKSVMDFRDSILKTARNKIVFHFDSDLAKEYLERFDLPSINFASGSGKYTGELYFGLADEIAINFLLKPRENESDESLKERYAEILKKSSIIIDRFLRAADLLMADVLINMGFVLRPK